MVLSNTDFYATTPTTSDYERLLQMLQQLEFYLIHENTDDFLHLLESILHPPVPYGSEQQAFLLNNLKTLFLNAIYKGGRQNDFLESFRSMSIFYEPYEKMPPLYRKACIA